MKFSPKIMFVWAASVVFDMSSVAVNAGNIRRGSLGNESLEKEESLSSNSKPVPTTTEFLSQPPLPSSSSESGDHPVTFGMARTGPLTKVVQALFEEIIHYSWYQEGKDAGLDSTSGFVSEASLDKSREEDVDASGNNPSLLRGSPKSRFTPNSRKLHFDDNNGNHHELTEERSHAIEPPMIFDPKIDAESTFPPRENPPGIYPEQVRPPMIVSRPPKTEYPIIYQLKPPMVKTRPPQKGPPMIYPEQVKPPMIETRPPKTEFPITYQLKPPMINNRPPKTESPMIYPEHVDPSTIQTHPPKTDSLMIYPEQVDPSTIQTHPPKTNSPMIYPEQVDPSTIQTHPPKTDSPMIYPEQVEPPMIYPPRDPKEYKILKKFKRAYSRFRMSKKLRFGGNRY